MFQVDLQTAPPLAPPTQAKDLQRTLPSNETAHAMWHNYTGLIVSPMTRTMPTDFPARVDSRRIEDYMKPRQLEDELAYYAFYPRKPIHGSYLFSDLAITPQAIDQGIQVTDTGFVINYDLQKRLSRLEDSLLSVAFSLLGGLPPQESAHLPQLSYPRWPTHYGYKRVHKTQEYALYSGRCSVEAFTMLSAFVSFALSLWLTKYEATCLDKAFEMLANRAVDPVPRVWLHYFKESIVCDFSPGLRPGAFLDAYTTKLGFFNDKFAFASVPLWFVWGKNPGETQPCDFDMYQLLPPLYRIEQAKRAPLQYRRVILPTHQSYVFERSRTVEPYFSPMESNERSEDYAPLPNGVFFTDPDPLHVLPASVDRRGVVEEHSRQRPHESWTEFSKRMEEGYEKRKAIETAKERQSREMLERMAREKGHTKTTSVFFWKQDEVEKDFYRRTRVIKSEVEFYWDDSTEHQRRFWSHLKEWDICPQLPAYPEGAPQPPAESPYHFLEEIDYLDPESMQGAQKAVEIQTLPVAASMLSAVQDALWINSSGDEERYVYPLITLQQYLSFRHGFDATVPDAWSPQLHVSPTQAFYTPLDQPTLALKKLLYTPELARMSDGSQISVIDFLNTACSNELSVNDLPTRWDISNQLQGNGALYVNSKIFITQRVNNAIDGEKNTSLFIIRPPPRSKDKSPWFVATTSATAVLLVYRSPWTTMLEVGRGLLNFGIPFRTVLEKRCARSEAPRSWGYKTIGLGLRPRGFVPTLEDYAAYKHARELVLKSWRGRAIRMRGGVLGRIAAETVPDVEVLDGPLRANELVGTLGEVGFFDDGVDDEDLDIVSGVYVVPKERSEAHLSWWPKHGTWGQTGLAGDQWSPLAEQFYAKRLEALERGAYDLPKATSWKQNYRFYKPGTARFIGGSENVADKFLRTSPRGMQR